MQLESIKEQIKASIALKNQLLTSPAFLAMLVEVTEAMVAVFQNKGRLLIAGNGGSAADAQHIAGELVGRFLLERAALSAIALSADTSVLTALGNDYAFAVIFARQVEAHGRAGDLFWGISTSGNSVNVLEALKTAKRIGMVTVGLTGQGGGKMLDLCDYCLCIPSCDTPRVQESMLLAEHIICGLVEKTLFGK